jgi:dephospho-CoA kinase
MALVIGLTGGIGSGKSAVTNRLIDFGIPVIDTDEIARQVVQPNSTGLQKISQAFGQDYIDSNGTLNRAKLRQLVFNNPEKKVELEAILHPLIRQQTKQQITGLKEAGATNIVIAIPLLVEAISKNKQPDYIDQIWVVDSSIENQIKRACLRDKAEPGEIQKIIDSQASREQRRQNADIVIENNGSLEQLYKQVDQLIHSIKN